MTNSDMQSIPSDMTPEEARAALAWFIEMGADEIVGEEPVNRFLTVAAAPVVTAAPLVKPVVKPVAKPKGSYAATKP